MMLPFNRLLQRYNLKFKGVLHIGSNVCEERTLYDQNGINKQIWIDGNYYLIPQIEKNIAHNPNAKFILMIVGDEDLEEQTLHISNNAGQSSSVLELGTHLQEHPDVYFIEDIKGPQKRVDHMDLDLTDIDLLNIDLQGFDLPALKGMGNLLHQFKAVFIEVNKSEVYKLCDQIPAVDKYLANYGFKRVETFFAPNKTWGDALYIK